MTEAKRFSDTTEIIPKLRGIRSTREFLEKNYKSWLFKGFVDLLTSDGLLRRRFHKMTGR